jgi:hypothetical protein
MKATAGPAFTGADPGDRAAGHHGTAAVIAVEAARRLANSAKNGRVGSC